MHTWPYGPKQIQLGFFVLPRHSQPTNPMAWSSTRRQCLGAARAPYRPAGALVSLAFLMITLATSPSASAFGFLNQNVAAYSRRSSRGGVRISPTTMTAKPTQVFVAGATGRLGQRVVRSETKDFYYMTAGRILASVRSLISVKFGTFRSGNISFGF